jgi:hypothetical protein
MSDSTENIIDINTTVFSFKVIACLFIFAILMIAVFFLRFRLHVHIVSAFRSGDSVVLKVPENELTGLHVHDKLLLLPCKSSQKVPCTVENIGKIASDGTSDVTLHPGNSAFENGGTDGCPAKQMQVLSESRSLFKLIFSAG